MFSLPTSPSELINTNRKEFWDNRKKTYVLVIFKKNVASGNKKYVVGQKDLLFINYADELVKRWLCEYYQENWKYFYNYQWL